MKRPEPSEYHEYYGAYIDSVPEGNILSILESGVESTLARLRGIPRETEDYSYAPGKWSIREVIGHIIDSERMFAYRALSFARRDPARLPSFEQEQYPRFSNASRRSLADLGSELASVRKSTVSLFASFDEEMWERRGIASEVEFGVRAFPYIIAGHEIHHRRVLEQRYLLDIVAGTP